MANKGSADMSKLHWNYRVIRYKPCGQSEWFQIGRVYYEDDQITGWANGEDMPGGDNMAELTDQLAMMRDALSRPILNAEDLPR